MSCKSCGNSNQPIRVYHPPSLQRSQPLRIKAVSIRANKKLNSSSVKTKPISSIDKNRA